MQKPWYFNREELAHFFGRYSSENEQLFLELLIEISSFSLPVSYDSQTYLLSPGGGGNLTCPWYGVVPFLGSLFHDRVRIYGYGFQQFFAFSGFMGTVFCKNSFLVSFCGISGFLGMIFRNFVGFIGILLRNFSGFLRILPELLPFLSQALGKMLIIIGLYQSFRFSRGSWRE